VTLSKQGDLDGLCGVYSIINGLSLLWPREMCDSLRTGLSIELCGLLNNRGISAVGGTTRTDQRDLLVVAQSAVLRALPGRLLVETPWAHRSTGSVADWRKRLADYIGGRPQSVALLSLYKPAHWTVASDISEKHFSIADSGTIPSKVSVTDVGLYRDMKAAKYVADPIGTFILTRT
jgi:hypothetical protein